jgi:hypothetical protein
MLHPRGAARSLTRRSVRWIDCARGGRLAAFGGFSSIRLHGHAAFARFRSIRLREPRSVCFRVNASCRSRAWSSRPVGRWGEYPSRVATNRLSLCARAWLLRNLLKCMGFDGGPGQNRTAADLTASQARPASILYAVHARGARSDSTDLHHERVCPPPWPYIGNRAAVPSDLEPPRQLPERKMINPGPYGAGGQPVQRPSWSARFDIFVPRTN